MGDGFFMDDSYLELQYIEKRIRERERINEKVLISNGFVKDESKLSELMNEEWPNYVSYSKDIDGKYFIDIQKGLSNIDYEKNWIVHVDNYDRCSIGNVDIESVGQFNKFMEVLNINYKLL